MPQFMWRVYFNVSHSRWTIELIPKQGVLCLLWLHGWMIKWNCHANMQWTSSLAHNRMLMILIWMAQVYSIADCRNFAGQCNISYQCALTNGETYSAAYGNRASCYRLMMPMVPKQDLDGGENRIKQVTYWTKFLTKEDTYEVKIQVLKL